MSDDCPTCVILRAQIDRRDDEIADLKRALNPVPDEVREMIAECGALAATGARVSVCGMRPVEGALDPSDGVNEPYAPVRLYEQPVDPPRTVGPLVAMYLKGRAAAALARKVGVL